MLCRRRNRSPCPLSRVLPQPQDDVGGNPGGALADDWAALGAVTTELVERFQLLRIVQAVGAAELQFMDLGALRVAFLLLKPKIHFGAGDARLLELRGIFQPLAQGDRLARFIHEDCVFAHNRPQDRDRRSRGFRHAAEQRAQDSPGLILSKRPEGAGRSPKGGLFVTCS
jgi:hypothetical protein